MGTIITPSEQQVSDHLLYTLKHCFRVEYFRQMLGYGKNDPQKPHDIEGQYNKYSWPVLSGLSFVGTTDDLIFLRYILPALELHRLQFHHQKFNPCHPEDFTGRHPDSTIDDMLFGAIDAVCSLLERRQYQETAYSYDEIQAKVESPPHQKRYILHVAKKMQRLEQPKTILISDFRDFPNIGLDAEMYEAIRRRVDETLTMLREEHGYRL